MTNHVLLLNASLRGTDSITSGLTDKILTKLSCTTITERDLAKGLPLIDEAWTGANFTSAEDRTDAQNAALKLSDTLIAELHASDTIVLGLPIYNFSVPTSFRAWIDLVARVGLTFQYTENGPQGLLQNKRAIIAIASGGTKLDSDIDFVTGYLRHILGFIGVTDVTIVAADALMADADVALATAHAQISALTA